MSNSDTYTVQLSDGQGGPVTTATIVVPWSVTDQDQQTIAANIVAAKTALATANSAVKNATATTQLAALQQYAAANTQAWQALLPALKYIAERLAS